MRKDFFTPPWRERDGGKKGRKVKIEREGERKSCCEQRGGERSEGRDGQGEGKRVGVLACAVRNADPFPRWPHWTISLPTAGPQDHNVSLPPPSGPAPRIHNVSHDTENCIHYYSQRDEAVKYAYGKGADKE